MSSFGIESRDSLFACHLADVDLVRACAPTQPDKVKVGQTWLRLATGTEVPVKAIRDQCIDLGGPTYTCIVDEQTLRREFVCTDAPGNVTALYLHGPGL